MTDWRSLQEKDYLGAWDLAGRDGRPRDYTLEIERVESKALKTKQTPKGKRKAIVRFRGAEKALVANSTNCETIEGMYGRDIEGWIGKLVTLYPTTCDVGPKRGVPCIRIRPRIPTGRVDAIVAHPVDQEQRAQQNEAFERKPGVD